MCNRCLHAIMDERAETKNTKYAEPVRRDSHHDFVPIIMSIGGTMHSDFDKWCTRLSYHDNVRAITIYREISLMLIRLRTFSYQFT
jgi:hypothetical protein